MNRHSIWVTPREAHEPSFERIPPLWFEYRLLFWPILAGIVLLAAGTSGYGCYWVASTGAKVKRIESHRAEFIDPLRNN